MQVIASLCVILCSIGLTKCFCLLANNSILMDKPNDRSLHSTPKVRGGGVIFIGLPLILLPFIAYWNATAWGDVLIMSLSILAIATVSFLDDIFHLSIKPRFAVQIMVALLFISYTFPISLNFGLFSITNPIVIGALLFVTILWAINHFNFMDGIDGFCALQAMFLFMCYAIGFAAHQATFYENFSIVLIFSLIGFLVYNFPPAKLFMGDVGSATLGFISICFAIIGQEKYGIPILYWFVLNGLFLFDATITLLRRILNKEKWYAPHRKHAYQRLRQYGVSNRWILFGQMLINGLLVIIVLLFERRYVNGVLVFVLPLLMLGAVYGLIERKYPMH